MEWQGRGSSEVEGKEGGEGEIGVKIGKKKKRCEVHNLGEKNVMEK